MKLMPTIAAYAAAHELGLANNIRNGCTPRDAAILYGAAMHGIDFDLNGTPLRNAREAFNNYYESLNL